MDKYNFPTEGLVRLPQVLEFLNISKSCWWQGVKDKRFPQPIKLGRGRRGVRMKCVPLRVTMQNKGAAMYYEGKHPTSGNLKDAGYETARFHLHNIDSADEMQEHIINENEKTLCPDAGKQTDRTDRTDFLQVSNADFMQAIFGELADDAKPFVVSKVGNPKHGGWGGKVWHGDNALPATANNYFSLAMFYTDEEGNHKRQKQYCAGIHVIVLDDIGEKVALDKITLLPTYRLETSQGNFQYGYKLNEPLTDLAVADKLANVLADAGLTDAGMNGFSTRLARLPEGMNGKHSTPFQCRLHGWNPELSYSIEELCSGLGVSLELTITSDNFFALALDMGAKWYYFVFIFIGSNVV